MVGFGPVVRNDPVRLGLVRLVGRVRVRERSRGWGNPRPRVKNRVGLASMSNRISYLELQFDYY